MVKIPKPSDFFDTKHLPPKAVLAEIGRIAAVSAGIEDTIHGIHWKYSGVTERVGRIITGDVKPSRLTEDILRIAEAANVRAAIISDLKDLFADYKATATRRNQYVHWIWFPSGEKGVFVVEPPAYKTGQTAIRATLADIAKLADDLVWIETRLQMHELSDADLLKEREKYKDRADIFAPAPWLN